MMESHESAPREPPWLLCLSCLLWAGFVGGVLVTRSTLPSWALPSFVGACWGTIFICGMALTAGVYGTAYASGAVMGLLMLAWGGLSAMTQLGDAITSLSVAILASAGWLVARFDISRTDAGRRFHRRWDQLTLFDAAVWTALIAITVLGFREASSAASLNGIAGKPVSLLNLQLFVWQATLSALAGTVASWSACRVAWMDSWSRTSALLLAVSWACVVGLIYCVASLRPADTSLWPWTLAGPVQAVAAQAATVLTGCALLRLQRSYLYCPTLSGSRSSAA